VALSGIYETRNTIKDAQCAFDTSVHVRQCKWAQILQDRERTEAHLRLGAILAGQNEKRKREYAGNRKYGRRG
jgi:hypothetical protein